MPHGSLTILPGVDTTKTPALNQAAISQSNLIRFLPDQGGSAVPQKLGGWINWPGYTLPFSSPIRGLKAWQDLHSNEWLGVGCQGGLYSISNATPNSANVITPQQSSATVSPWSGSALNIFVSAGTDQVHIVDETNSTNVFSFVNFINPVSVGGIIVSGPYQITQQVSAHEYVITTPTTAAFSTSQTAAITIASPAVITVANAPDSGTPVIFQTTGSLPTGIVAGTTYYVENLSPTTFSIAATVGGEAINTSGTQSGTQTAYFPATTRYLTTSSGSAQIDVIFPYSNQSVGLTDNYAIPVSVGGLTIYQNYQITSVSGVDEYGFYSQSLATSGASVFDDSGNASLSYYLAATAGAPATAFGADAFGSSDFGGAAVPATSGSPITATDWWLDNWGDQLIACPTGGAIYYWSPNSFIPNAQYISGAPLYSNGAFVAMPERQIMAWGSSYSPNQDPLLVRWSDVNNYNVWTAQSTNQAGSYRIPTGSRIVGGIQAPQQALFWTDIDLYSAQYVGYPAVYGFNKISSNCGMIAPKAAGVLNNLVYWMGPNQFYMLSSQGAAPLICPIWDIVFQNIDRNNINKIRCAPNTTFNEIFWFYPSANGTGENDSYVKLNVVTNQWDYGSLGRSAWIDQSVLGTPIGAGTDNYLYQHEQGENAAGLPMNSYFTTGYFAISEGDNLVFMDQVWPDLKWGEYGAPQNETVYLTINAVYYPTDAPFTYGPFPMTSAIPFINCRVRGRLFSFTISSNDAGQTFWRLGRIRYRFAPDGKF